MIRALSPTITIIARARDALAPLTATCLVVGDLPVAYKLEEQLLERVAGAASAAAQPVEYNVVLAQKG